MALLTSPIARNYSRTERGALELVHDVLGVELGIGPSSIDPSVRAFLRRPMCRQTAKASSSARSDGLH